MSIKQFAEAHRLKTATDSDGTSIIRGRDGQLYEHGDGRLGMIFSSDRFTSREGWNTRRKKCEAAGMELHQDGDYEGSLLFDPMDKAQAQLAIKTAGARSKRQLSPENLAKFIEAGKGARYSSTATATAGATAS